MKSNEMTLITRAVPHSSLSDEFTLHFYLITETLFNNLCPNETILIDCFSSQHSFGSCSHQTSSRVY